MSESFVDQAEERLRHDIINSVFSGGDRLRVEELSKRYGVGPTPVREALSRLKSEGLVVLSNNRGFSVPELSLEDCIDLATTRSVVESEAVRNAIQHRTEDWELGLYLATERLRRRAQADLSVLENWEALWEEHNRFHGAMLKGCRLKRLLVMQNSLEQQHSRYYRRLPFSKEWAADFILNHDNLVAVALSGDADAAAAMTRSHAMLTSDTLLKTGLSALGPGARPEPRLEAGQQMAFQ